MEFGSIEREFRIDATPEVVFDVISRPEHIRQWWDAETELEPVAGATGELAWADRTGPGTVVSPITVVDADPPRRFAFRWVHPGGAVATAANSLLVTFDLVPSGAGTVVRFKETGYRETGWEVAVLEETYREHCVGWDHFLPRLGEYVTRLVSSQ